jgi:hypothetical protein
MTGYPLLPQCSVLALYNPSLIAVRVISLKSAFTGGVFGQKTTAGEWSAACHFIMKQTKGQQEVCS